MKKFSIKGGLSSPFVNTLIAFLPMGLVFLAIYHYGKPLLESIGKIGSVPGTILDNIGITKSKDTKKNETTNVDSGSPFSPSYISKLRPGLRIKLHLQSSIDYLVNEIYDSRSVLFPSDFPRLMGAIKACRYKTQVCQLSTAFYKKYNKDLLSFLDGWSNAGFQPDEVRQFIEYANSLPVGTY